MAVQGAYTFEEGGRRRRKRMEKVKDGNDDGGQTIVKIGKFVRVVNWKSLLYEGPIGILIM